jgi:hypothetical protein
MRFLCLATLVMLHFALYSQKQGNIWYFGNQAGLNFNSGQPVVLAGGQTGTNVGPGENQEGTSCISDSSGTLLFYANGKGVWNSNNQLMPNASDMQGGLSSTQAALIVPKPGNDSLFYVFFSDEFQSYTSPPLKGYRYSIVNMCLDNKKGDVIPTAKNVLLLDSATEKLSACPDAAGTGYWVLGHKMFSNQFHAWHLTTAGITATVVSGVGMIHGLWPNLNPPYWFAGMAQGQMKFNPQCTRVGLVHGNHQPALLDLFDFNNSTGVVSNPCQIVSDSVMLKSPYGLEFSPDGSKVYIALSGGSGGNRLHQYDLNAGSCTAVRASDALIYQSSVSNPAMYGMQVATDNRIYMVAGNNLASINLPNLPGIACGFNPSSISAATFSNGFTVPSFVAGFAYTNDLVACAPFLTASTSASIICAGEQATLVASGASSYTWSTGSNSSSITVNPGTTTSYTVTGYGNGMAGVVMVVTQSVAACTGISSMEGDPLMSVFPNPSRGLLQIEGSVVIDFIEVSDLLGRIIYQNNPGQAKHTFTIHDPGMIVVKIQAGGRTFRQKLLIEKD